MSHHLILTRLVGHLLPTKTLMASSLIGLLSDFAQNLTLDPKTLDEESTSAWTYLLQRSISYIVPGPEFRKGELFIEPPNNKLSMLPIPSDLVTIQTNGQPLVTIHRGKLTMTYDEYYARAISTKT